MSHARALEEIAKGKLRPVYLVVGEEPTLRTRVVSALRAAVVGAKGEEGLGLNEDRFEGKTHSAELVLNAARTLSMLSPTRFVLMREVDRCSNDELKLFAQYLQEPSSTSVLVLTAGKLNGNLDLMKRAKKLGARIDLEAPKARDLGAFIRAEADARGHAISPRAANAIAELIGEDVGGIDDALERLSLYVGAGQRIDEAAISAIISRSQVDSIWALVDAISARDRVKATRAAATLLMDREPPLRILSMIARQIRMVAKMRDALARGLTPSEAAKAAGAPPFKANELAQAAKRFKLDALARASEVLAETDLLLKGSQIPGDVALQRAVLILCGARDLEPLPPARARQASAI